MKKISTILGLFLLVFLPNTKNAFACSYQYIPSVYQSYKNASIVLTGKVIASEGSQKARKFRVEMTEIYKGAEKTDKKEIEIFNEENMCESGFAIGESYLIYAYEYDDKIFHTYNFATRNANLTDAQDQIYFLNELLKGKRESQVYGSVVRNDNNPTSNQSHVTNLQNIKVEIEGNGKSFETLTDKRGIFYFNKIPKGNYSVKITLPDVYKVSSYPNEESFLVLSSGRVVTGANIGMFLDGPQAEKEIENALYSRGEISDGAYFDFSTRWNNEISGKILDAEGTEIFADVGLVPVSNPLQKIRENYNKKIGKYSIFGLAPAKYYLAAEIYVPMSGKEKIRYFYPQTGKSIEANVIDIRATDKFTFDWQIPLVRRSIEGKVYWEDGTPIVGDVRVCLSKSENYDEESQEITYSRSSLDGASSFSLNGYVGADYWIQVIAFPEGYSDGKLETIKIKARPTKIKIDKFNEPLKILIPKPDKITSTN